MMQTNGVSPRISSTTAGLYKAVYSRPSPVSFAFFVRISVILLILRTFCVYPSRLVGYDHIFKSAQRAYLGDSAASQRHNAYVTQATAGSRIIQANCHEKLVKSRNDCTLICTCEIQLLLVPDS